MKKLVKLLLIVAAVSFLINTVLFWVFEHGRNPEVRNLFDAIWWWVVTSATVGYGDIVPVTWQGRAVGIFAIITGFFIYINFVAIITQSAHEYLERRSRGIVQIKARNHIVICEYTAIADEFIQSLPECVDFAGCEIVIVSDLVSRSPYPQHHFVSGVPINPAALRQANIEHADYVFIFANLRFADPDVKTMHIASRVLNLNPKAMVFVELIDPGNDLLKYAPEKLIVMDSRKLIEYVLRGEKIDPRVWMGVKRKH